MLLEDIVVNLGCKVVRAGAQDASCDVRAAFAADLMSDVLAFSGPGALLITGLTSVQSVHTADVADLAAVLYVNGKLPVQQAIDVAAERGLPLLSTSASMFEACGVLHAKGLPTSTKPRRDGAP